MSDRAEPVQGERDRLPAWHQGWLRYCPVFGDWQPWVWSLLFSVGPTRSSRDRCGPHPAEVQRSAAANLALRNPEPAEGRVWKVR